jgi:hypothetical protein
MNFSGKKNYLQQASLIMKPMSQWDNSIENEK